jgi:hypothetical protein
MLGAVSFWLETLWWGGIAVLGIGATISAIQDSPWAQRREQRRFGAYMKAQWLRYLAKVRDREIAAMREQDKPG